MGSLSSPLPEGREKLPALRKLPLRFAWDNVLTIPGANTGKRTPIPSSQAQLCWSRWHPGDTLLRTTLPRGWCWPRGAGAVPNTLTCRMQPCEESGPTGITRLYRSEIHNTRGQMTLARSRVQTGTLTFLRQSSDRSALFNLFYTNDQVRKFSHLCFIWVIF